MRTPPWTLTSSREPACSVYGTLRKATVKSFVEPDLKIKRRVFSIPPGWLAILIDHLVNLEKSQGSYENPRDLIITEQVFKACSAVLQVFLKEGSCLTLKDYSHNADTFMEAQMLHNLSREGNTKTTVAPPSKSDAGKKTALVDERCSLCDKNWAQSCGLLVANKTKLPRSWPDEWQDGP